MDRWGEDAPVTNPDIEYQNIRNKVLDAFEMTLLENDIPREKIKGNEYKLDVYFGAKLYEIFNHENGFTVRNASDDGVWRHLSLKVLPDIVHLRWGNNPIRFWKESRRIWLKTLWWYIHLSWQGNIHSTLDILKDNTTDEIVQLIERSGRLGYRVDLYREIMQYFGQLSPDKKKRTDLIFRKVMKLNTARVKVIEPALLLGGEAQYVKELFEYFDSNE
ncbi:hypothetical protein AB685_16955 [Bacillus sp. LL01]|nr:hypothetical protein AB685_16955 [Bacillus sp. LL01]